MRGERLLIGEPLSWWIAVSKGLPRWETMCLPSPHSPFCGFLQKCSLDGWGEREKVDPWIGLGEGQAGKTVKSLGKRVGKAG